MNTTVKTTMKTTAFKDKSARRFITPSLTLSAAALGVSAAHGAVVVSDFADVTTTGANNWQSVVFNTTTGSAFTATVSNSTTRIDFTAAGSQNFGKGPEWFSAYATQGASASRVSNTMILLGSVVDSGTSFINQKDLTTATNLTDAYLGVRMASGSNFHYGWIKFSTGPDLGGGRGPGSVTIQSAALETTPNVGITIPSAVPEPSSVLLLGLAAGAGAFRRRRQAA
jgi:hypothetical protein